MRLSVRGAVSCLVLAVLPGAIHGASTSQQEFDSALHRTPDPNHGRILFDESCAACHESGGAGATDGSVPAVAGQHFRVVVRELVDFRHATRWDPRMQHFADDHHLSGTQDIADLAAYISRLPPTASAVQDSDEDVQQGAEIYTRQCASCHGAGGEGNNRQGFPRLAGQHREYLLSQMQYAVQGLRPNFSQEHIRLLRRLQAQDVRGVAQYLSHLGP